MTNLSNTQTKLLTEAVKAPSTCITTFMADIKNPMIRQKSLDSMLAKGVIEKQGDIYRITEAGNAAIGNTPQQDAATGDKPKRETKQSTITSLLEREEGVTLAELQKATEWKPHSVRGHLSNMRRKQKANIETTTNSDGNRVYRIAKEA